MDILNYKSLRELALVEGEYLISLFSPMQRAGREVRQNEIHWKTIVKDAKSQLIDAGLEEHAANELLRPASEKINDNAYWQRQSDGLAMFLSESGDQEVKSPTSFKQNVIIDNRYHLRPLLGMANDNAHCFVLATSSNRVRLFEVTGDNVQDMQPEQLPESLHEALNIDEYVSALQFHSTSTGAAQGKQAAAFHGHGGSDPDVKKQDELLQYFHRLDKALADYFGAEKAPLIFIGVDYLFPIFRQVCSYPNLHNESVSGNPDEMSPEDILQQIRPITEGLRERREMEMIASYQEKVHTDWASEDPNEIYLAAKMGQVESLMLSSNFTAVAALSDTGNLEISDRSDKQSAADVGNLILIEVLRCGGQAVELCESRHSEIPGVSAIFRSPAGKFANE